MSFADLQQQSRMDWERFSDPRRPRILVGAATCGRAAGALNVLEAVRKELEARNLTSEVTVAEVGCLGLCYAEPLVEIRGRDGRSVLYQEVDPRGVPTMIAGHFDGAALSKNAFAVMDGDALDAVVRFTELPMIRQQTRIILRNSGVIDPTNLHHYVARGGYSGLARALTLTPEQVIGEVKTAGLRGRGGAGFPTATKWSFARGAKGDQKYVICNADEGDPGAFMNRSVLEGDPHAVLEGLVIAGYAIGASVGYVYVRAEYPLAVERIAGAIEQMKSAGLLGNNILGGGFDFEIQILKGAGAFVCGEETALMQSIEGRRGMPRSRPPFPAISGLFAKPTNINNVETLAAVSAILGHGAGWYASHGTESSRGTKTFSLAGKIQRTGLIEVALGTPLRTIIDDIGGGVLDGKRFKAVQTGGPSGGCIPAEHLDLSVDYEHLAQVGSIMGSGGMVVMDEDSCMVDVARYFLSFTESESCGKCVPCRMGTQHLLRILTDITQGHGQAHHIEQMQRIGQTMKKASLCGLGQTAANPVLTTLRYFENEYRAHLDRNCCEAGVCRELIEFSIDAEACTGCTACSRACPIDAIAGEKKGPHRIDPLVCIHCGSCRSACKFDAVKMGTRTAMAPPAPAAVG
ncbi:MAG TPA: NADH-quinone oxidoreductase subunit NuoF [Tepidisphaeraceae bacterium]|jgi:NADH:ubiquinone oxidoreductase subunit F (NADH-binding)/NAD-dependent dihydropyrimidine dehydrogenase PreA subunit/(2Fe-2S) ferredoxin